MYRKGKVVYKIIFQLITNPLGLPISALWEYIILIVINNIAFQIAWSVSPGSNADRREKPCQKT